MQTYHLDQLSTQTSLPVDGVGVWLPSEQISHHEIPLPTAPRRKWQSLLPWLMEDQVLESVEKLHFTIIATTDEHLQVLAIRRSDIDACLEQAKKVEVNPLCVQPDYLALPWQTGKVILAWRLSGDSRVLVVRTGETSGFAAPEALAEVLVNKLLLNKNSEEFELIACMPEEALPAFLQSRDISFESAPDWQEAMHPSLNFLSGEYGINPQSNYSSKGIWATAAMGVLALVLVFSWLKVDAIKLETELAALEDAQRLQLSRLFPDVRVSGSNLRLALEKFQDDRMLQEMKLREPAAELMMALDSVLSDCECALESVNFNSTGATLTFTKAPTAALAAMKMDSVTSVTTTQDAEGKTQVVLKRAGG